MKSVAKAFSGEEPARASPKRMPESINERGSSPKGYRSIPT